MVTHTFNLAVRADEVGAVRGAFCRYMSMSMHMYMYM